MWVIIVKEYFSHVVDMLEYEFMFAVVITDSESKVGSASVSGY